MRDPAVIRHAMHMDGRKPVPFGVSATLASLTESVMSRNSLGTPRGKAIVVVRPGHVKLLPGGSTTDDPQAEQPDRSSMLNSAMYESFFSLSVDMLCVAGYDGFFKHLNSAWTQTLGFTDAELMERPFLDIIHPEDRLATI